MSVVTVSSKYQIVIPRSVREQAGIEPGQQVDVVWDEGQIHVTQVPTLEALQDLCRGMDRSFEREPDRPL